MLYRLSVGAIIRCSQSTAESGFLKIVGTQPLEQTSSVAKSNWTILAVECDEKGDAKNSNYFKITQEEIDRWQEK